MYDQSWPTVVGAALVVLFFAVLLTYILVISARRERHERQTIEARKRIDTQQMIRKMRERHQGSSLLGMEPESQLVLPTIQLPSRRVITEETPVGGDGSSETKIRNIGTTSGNLESRLIGLIERKYVETQELVRLKQVNQHQTNKVTENGYGRLDPAVLRKRASERTAASIAANGQGPRSLREILATGGALDSETLGKQAIMSLGVIGDDPIWFDRQHRLLRCGDRAMVFEDTDGAMEEAVLKFRYDHSHPPRGQELAKHCDETSLVAVFADGQGGSYSNIISHNSPQCGYPDPS